MDAVIIATPDQWHGTMTIDALKAGKHVYCEKPMTWTVPETYMVREAVRTSNRVFQLGHQNRQIEIYNRAREIAGKRTVGTYYVGGNQVPTETDPNGAWVYPIDPEANPKTIDWKQFEGDPERIKEYLDYMSFKPGHPQNMLVPNPGIRNSALNALAGGVGGITVRAGGDC